MKNSQYTLIQRYYPEIEVQLYIIILFPSYGWRLSPLNIWSNEVIVHDLFGRCDSRQLTVQALCQYTRQNTWLNGPAIENGEAGLFAHPGKPAGSFIMIRPECFSYSRQLQFMSFAIWSGTNRQCTTARTAFKVGVFEYISLPVQFHQYGLPPATVGIFGSTSDEPKFSGTGELLSKPSYR